MARAKRRSRGLSLAGKAFLIGAVLLVIGLQAQAAISQPATKLRLGVPTWIGYGAIYIAQEKGFLSGATIELRRSDDANVFNAAMLRGELDGYCTTLDTFVIAAASGVPGVVVYLFDESAGADGILVRPGITSVSDLRGKKIAAQTGYPNHFFLLHVMRSAGIPPASYTHVNLDSDKAGAAFVSGRLDAAVTWEPWLSQARELGKGTLLTTSRDHPSLLVDALIAHPATLQHRGEQMRSLVRGLLKAVDFWKANPMEGNSIVAKHFSLAPNAVGEMVRGVRFLDQADNREYLAPQGRAWKTLTAAADIWLEAKLIKKAPNLSKAMSGDLVK
jgi:NitT/TauT family transport system substrate-binding protein